MNMDSKAQTKTPGNRRTMYIIVGLIAVICVLSIQLYKQNNVKKALVRRKAFYIGKLYDCKAAGEKGENKYKVLKDEKKTLKSQLDFEQEAHQKTKGTLNDLETSYQTKTEDVKKLQHLAEDNKRAFNELKESYDSAMLSFKSTQGKLDNMIIVCDTHKANSQSLNQSMEAKMKEIETCKEEKLNLQQANQRLQENEQKRRSIIDNMEGVRTANTGGRAPHAPKEPSIVQSVSPNAQQVLHTGSATQNTELLPAKSSQEKVLQTQSNQNAVFPAQSSQTTNLQTQSSKIPGQASVPQGTVQKSPIEVTPSFQQPTTQQTIKLSEVTADESDSTPSSDNGVV